MNKISIKKKDKNFVILDKSCLNDLDLSWKAKGLHSYIMALPDDWKLNLLDLGIRSSDKTDSTTSAINELIAYGYVERVRTHNEKGKFSGYDYTVYETSEPHLRANELPKYLENLQKKNGKIRDWKEKREFISNDGKTVNGETVIGNSKNGETKNGFSYNGNSNTNNNIDKEVLNKVNIEILNIDGEKTPPTNENDFVNFEVVEKVEPETLNEEKKEKEKKLAAKKRKRTIDEVYPDSQAFVFAWQAQYQGAQYSQIDPEKLYRRISNYCRDSGKTYADYIGRVMVWYDEAKDKTAYHFNKNTNQAQSNYDILANMVANMDNSNSRCFLI